MTETKYRLADFIDRFQAARLEERMAMVKNNPFPDLMDKQERAYLAAMVEELCVRSQLPVPSWVEERAYFLKAPFFVGGLESLKAFLLVESPVSFRRRNIFVSENVLSRV